MRTRSTLAAVLAFSALALAQERPTELAATVPLLLKVLTYDTNFDSRGVGDFVVLVVSDGPAASDRKSLFAAIKELPTLKIKARAVHFVQAEVKDEPSVQAEIDRTKPSALLVVPNTSDATVKAISEVLQDNQLYGLALQASMVEQAIPLGVSLGGGRPQIVINEKASKGVGVRYESSVLKLAKIIADR